MPLSMYEISVSLLIRNLRNLAQVLAKADAHSIEKGFDDKRLLDVRLFPDMFTLSRQVQVACDFSKGAVARLAGVEAPSYEDNEETFEELQSRIDKTIAFIDSVSPDQIDGTEEKEITQFDFNFQGSNYLLKFVIPNVIFHTTTAYNILRHNGVEIGKMDFLGMN